MLKKIISLCLVALLSLNGVLAFAEDGVLPDGIYQATAHTTHFAASCLAGIDYDSLFDVVYEVKDGVIASVVLDIGRDAKKVPETADISMEDWPFLKLAEMHGSTERSKYAYNSLDSFALLYMHDPDHAPPVHHILYCSTQADEAPVLEAITAPGIWVLCAAVSSYHAPESTWCAGGKGRRDPECSSVQHCLSDILLIQNRTLSGAPTKKHIFSPADLWGIFCNTSDSAYRL